MMTMMNRRRFLHTAAAGAAVLARMPNAKAATYDLVIRGGRVIDPSLGINAVGDVAIAAGKIAAVGDNNAAESTNTLDARGKLVMPGLIDIHTHAARSKEGPPLALLDGVTGWVDAGSAGADAIEDAVAVAKSGPNLGRLLIKISRPMSASPAARSSAIATSSSASRRDSRTTSPEPMISRRCGAPRRWRAPTACR
jgi:dihydroorotase